MRGYGETWGIAQGVLEQTCRQVGDLCGVELGGRVWALPAWYARLLKKDAKNRVALVELPRQVVDWPKMKLLGLVMGPFSSRSGLAWPIHRGLLGAVTLGEDDGGRPIDTMLIQHESHWPRELDSMTREEWSRLEDELTLNRSLDGARRLKEMYGTAIAVRIPLAGVERAGIGCLTVHSARGTSIPHEHVEDAVRMCSTMAQQIAHDLNCRLDWRDSS